MNEQINDLMYRAGLTAQGCWDSMDDYDRAAILKFAELIVRECAERLLHDVKLTDIQTTRCVASIKEHFGLEE